MKEIYLAGGCFWGVEHYIQQVKGVTKTEVGYANGNIDNPTYEQVCQGVYKFAEVVKVQFDESIIQLDEILNLFYLVIDPTSLNKQGNDRGVQYRTAIYYVCKEDIEIIDNSINQLSKKYDKDILIEVDTLNNYYPAEIYHQQYLYKNSNGYCHISPKMFELARNYKKGEKDEEK